MKKIWLSMFYSIQVGEDPTRNQNQVKMIRINPFFLRQRSYHFEGTGVTSLFHFHSRVLMCFHAL
ncbi:senescence associated protein [Salix suchowensis]|nr:senescence associated protein [Salix suchowensis]